MSEQEARDVEIARIEQSNNVADIVYMQIKRVWPDLHPVLDLRYGIADALWAAGYRKHPEPEITDEMVKRAEYVVCGEDYPWIELEDGVMLRALEAALRVPVGEGE